MNDPEIIEWLNSTDSDEWRRKAFPYRLQLLRMKIKEDVPNLGRFSEQFIMDDVIVELGIFE